MNESVESECILHTVWRVSACRVSVMRVNVDGECVSNECIKSECQQCQGDEGKCVKSGYELHWVESECVAGKGLTLLGTNSRKARWTAGFSAKI